MYLSKTDFQNGRKCPKRLWNEKQGNWRAERTFMDMKNAIEGDRFNNAVHKAFPGGIEIDFKQQGFERATEQTKSLLSQDDVILFEPVFIKDQFLCIADVMIKEGGRIFLIEAKSGTSPEIEPGKKDCHLYDAAYQTWVISKCGYQVDQIEVLHANKNCIWPNEKELFLHEDITELVQDRLEEVEIEAGRLLRIALESREPNTAIGLHCKKPTADECPHINSCWTKPTERTIYDLPRVNPETINLCESEGVHLIEDIPQTVNLSDALQKKVDVIQNQIEEVDIDKVEELMGQIRYPIHFFDFETYNPSVPMFDNSRPWQQIPFQYSLHILHGNGDLEHHEFLHVETDDPRAPLLEALKAHFLDSGTIVVYNQQFEKMILQDLSRDYPEEKVFLNALIDRLWDQLLVFKKGFVHHKLAMSNSIKVVLPAFVADLSYSHLNVKKGDEAQYQWFRTRTKPDGPSKKQHIQDLLAYCELDTLAMVRLHEFIHRVLELRRLP